MHKKLLPTLLSVFFLIAAWQTIAYSIGYPAIFPTLDKLVVELIRISLSDNFWSQLGATILRGAIGFVLAVVLAFGMAGVAAFSRFWETFFHPIVLIGRSLPIISLVLLALLWFSPTQLPVFIALLTMFPILYQHILTGLQLTDQRLVQMATVFGKSSLSRFRHLYLPSARSNMLSGFKTALGFGWRAVIMGEVLSQPLHGMGTAMKQAQIYINVPELIAWTVWAIAVSYLFDALLRMLARGRFQLHSSGLTRHSATTTSPAPALQGVKLVAVSKSFADNQLFNDFSFTLAARQLYFLKGTSGIGKTTLLNLICGIEKADSGTIRTIDSSPAFRTAFAFQDGRLLPWLTVSENLLFTGIFLPPDNRFPSLQSRMEYLLDKSGLTVHAHKYPHQLSGGQQQRVGLIRALAAMPDLLLLDEPLTGLDPDTKKEMLKLISAEISTYRPIVVWATHEEVDTDGLTAHIIELPD